MGAHDNQAPPQDNQVPPLEQVALGDKILVVPLPMKDGEIRENFLNLAKAMLSPANGVTSQVQAMTTQMDWEVGPRVPQHTSTMNSHLRDLTKMNPPMFYGSREDEDPQYFLDNSIRSYFLWV